MATGTLSADGTEQTIDTLTPGVPGFAFWYVDLENMAGGDTVVLRERVDVDDDGTFEQFSEVTYSDAQTNAVVSQSANLMTLSDVDVRITLEQTGGTNRNYPWATGVKH
jgi:hypothetical protein